MLILNGENWEIIPYTAEYKVTQPTMTKEGYPPDTVFTENKLTSEQQAKLDELNESVDKNISVEEATEFVFNPEPTDNRTEEEKLIEIIIELDPTKIEDETIQKNIREWEDYKDSAIGRGLLVRYNGKVYITVHPKRTTDKETPEQMVGITYALIPVKSEDTGLEEIIVDVTHTVKYDAGYIGTYKGRVYVSNFPNNTVEPIIGGGSQHWWTDLGTIEEYLASKGGE